MRNKAWLSVIAICAAGALFVAACGGDDNKSSSSSGSSSGGGGSKPGKVAVLLPDSKSSVRWETVDRPLLQKALEDGGVEANITNAEGDKSTQQQQAEQAITNGAKVILLVNLDSGSGAAIAANAKSQGVKVIDYDRLTLDTDANAAGATVISRGDSKVLLAVERTNEEWIAAVHARGIVANV